MAEATIHVELFMQPEQGPALLRRIELDAGACVADALAASGLTFDAAVWRIAIWGRLQTLQTVLEDGDRIDLLRPLRIDPKQARRLRARRR